jgi:hypothetical protein
MEQPLLPAPTAQPPPPRYERPDVAVFSAEALERKLVELRDGGCVVTESRWCLWESARFFDRGAMQAIVELAPPAQSADVEIEAVFCVEDPKLDAPKCWVLSDPATNALVAWIERRGPGDTRTVWVAFRMKS